MCAQLRHTPAHEARLTSPESGLSVRPMSGYVLRSRRTVVGKHRPSFGAIGCPLTPRLVSACLSFLDATRDQVVVPMALKSSIAAVRAG